MTFHVILLLRNNTSPPYLAQRVVGSMPTNTIIYVKNRSEACYSLHSLVINCKVPHATASMISLSIRESSFLKQFKQMQNTKQKDSVNWLHRCILDMTSVH